MDPKIGGHRLAGSQAPQGEIPQVGVSKDKITKEVVQEALSQKDLFGFENIQASHSATKSLSAALSSTAAKIASWLPNGSPLQHLFKGEFSIAKERLIENAKDKYGWIPKIGSQSTEKVEFNTDSVKAPKVKFSEVLSTYDPKFQPKANADNLNKYSTSDDFKRHAASARIYYNGNQLEGSDALRVTYQREPTNIAMGSGQYNKEKLQETFGYSKSVYNDPSAQKADGTSFNVLPNTATVYSETYLWNPPGGSEKKEVACISLPPPALDSPNQPNYKYYVQDGKLNESRYGEEMGFLFKTLETAIKDNKDSAFEGKGIQRVVLSRFGQGAFIHALSGEDKVKANQIYKEQMKKFLNNIADTGINVVMSEYSDPGSDVWLDKMVVGDIVNTAQEGDLIVNAWDPHSAPGNGNDADRSFDGALGKSTGILLTQTSWMNENLRNKDSLVPVK